MRALVAVLVCAAGALLGSTARAEEGGRVRCGGRSAVRGIDVSKWQGEVDWRAVRASGVRFAYIRVSDGSTILDGQFARNWERARAAGVMRGVYQYFRPEEDPVAQADLLLEAMGPPRAGDLPPAIDVEVSGGQDPRELVRRIGRWVDRVRSATGLRPVVYASALGWIALAGNSRRFRAHPLWVAHHDVECPSTPTGWRHWAFHQRSKRAAIGGIGGLVDENWFRGSMRGLRRLAVRSERSAARRWARWRRHAAVNTVAR